MKGRNRSRRIVKINDGQSVTGQEWTASKSESEPSRRPVYSVPHSNVDPVSSPKLEPTASHGEEEPGIVPAQSP